MPSMQASEPVRQAVVRAVTEGLVVPVVAEAAGALVEAATASRAAVAAVVAVVDAAAAGVVAVDEGAGVVRPTANS